MGLISNHGGKTKHVSVVDETDGNWKRGDHVDSSHFPSLL